MCPLYLSGNEVTHNAGTFYHFFIEHVPVFITIWITLEIAPTGVDLCQTKLKLFLG